MFSDEDHITCWCFLMRIMSHADVFWWGSYHKLTFSDEDHVTCWHFLVRKPGRYMGLLQYRLHWFHTKFMWYYHSICLQQWSQTCSPWMHYWFSTKYKQKYCCTEPKQLTVNGTMLLYIRIHMQLEKWPSYIKMFGTIDLQRGFCTEVLLHIPQNKIKITIHHKLEWRSYGLQAHTYEQAARTPLQIHVSMQFMRMLVEVQFSLPTWYLCSKIFTAATAA